MKIGELAKRAGVNIQTIRFYERESILRQPHRTASGYRAYTEDDLTQVVFVKECQHIGFTLGEIKQLSGPHSSLNKVPKGDEQPLQEIFQMAGVRLRLIDEKIASLQGMRQKLLNFLETAQCPASMKKNP